MKTANRPSVHAVVVRDPLTLDEACEGLRALACANKLMGAAGEVNMGAALIPLRRFIHAFIRSHNEKVEAPK